MAEDYSRDNVPILRPEVLLRVSKKCWLDEHFYGSGREAARLDQAAAVRLLIEFDTPGYTEGKDPIYQDRALLSGPRERIGLWIFFDNAPQLTLISRSLLSSACVLARKAAS